MELCLTQKLMSRFLKFILEQGENYKIEFKERFEKSLVKDICAFVNASGGRIFLGINDLNQIIGIDITNKLKTRIQDLAQNCDPQIKISFEGIDHILIINVPEGANKPYQCSGGFYFRQGPNSQKMRRDEIVNLIIDEGQVRFDEQVYEGFDFKKDFDKDKFEDYI